MTVPNEIWLWGAFNIFVLAMLALDLGVFHRRSHVVLPREAAAWTTVWIVLALAFNVGVYRFMGAEAGVEFLTAYLIEKALSVDNIFVFALIFGAFRVPPQYQHRVLFWGILGALVMRGAMIAGGAILLEHFEWVIYIFGGFLVITGVRMLAMSEAAVEVEDNRLIRLLRRRIPITESYRGASFFVREKVGGKVTLMATPLFIVLVLIETTDLIFALDSIPAVFGVTRDPFLVYTSNVFAILGLRALYFLLAHVIGRFRFLKPGLSAILVFVGVKMCLHEVVTVPTVVSLGVIVGVLALAAIASILFPARDTADGGNGGP